MAHKFEARFKSYYIDGVDGKPYRGRMRTVSVPAPYGVDVLRAWDGRTYEDVAVPVNDLAYEAWQAGRSDHIVGDHRGNVWAEKSGVQGCCVWSNE